MMQSSLIRRVVTTGSGFALTAVSVFLLNLVLSRLLAPTNFGLISLVLSWALIGAHVAQLGFNRASTKIVSIAIELQNNEELKTFFIFIVICILISSLFVGGAIYWSFDFLVKENDGFNNLGLVCALLIYPLALARMASGVLIGAGRTARGAFTQNGLPNLGILLVVFCGSVMGYVPGIESVSIALIIGAFIAGLCSVLGAGYSIRKVWSSPFGSVAWRPWLGLAIPIMLISSIQLFGRQIGIVIMGAQGSPEMVANYIPALRISELASFALLAVNSAVVAQLSVHFHKRDLSNLQKILSKTAKLIFSLTCVISIGIFILSGWLIGLFQTTDPTVKLALGILVLGQVFDASAGSLAVLMTVANQERYTAVIAAIVTLTNMAICLVLIPVFGIVGAATASTISMFVWNGFLWVRCKRKIGVDPTILSTFSRTYS